MAGTTTRDGPVLVAVSGTDQVEQLVRTAGDLARAGDRTVRIVSVAVKPHSSPFSIYSDETIVEEFAGNSREILEQAAAVAPDDVTVESEITVGRSVVDGVLDVIEETNASALVVGWQERRGRTTSVLGTTADQFVQRVPCDLYVERIGHEADGVDSVLLPVAGGPHVEPAARVTNAIAARNEASVTLLSVAAGDISTETAQESLTHAEITLEGIAGPDVEFETAIERDGDVTDVLVENAAAHDVLVFGATRRNRLHRRLVGSIPRSVVRQVDETVILARSGETVSPSVPRRLRRLLGERRSSTGRDVTEQ